MSVRWTTSEYEAFKAKHKQAIATPLPNPKPGKRVRQSSRPLMNKLETEWFVQLNLKFFPGQIAAQALKFRLGNGIWYKPDFIVFGDTFNGPSEYNAVAYEVKGPHSFRGGMENLKVAAGLYRKISWRLVWKDENGQWREQEILP